MPVAVPPSHVRASFSRFLMRMCTIYELLHCIQHNAGTWHLWDHWSWSTCKEECKYIPQWKGYVLPSRKGLANWLPLTNQFVSFTAMFVPIFLMNFPLYEEIYPYCTYFAVETHGCPGLKNRKWWWLANSPHTASTPTLMHRITDLQQ